MNRNKLLKYNISKEIELLPKKWSLKKIQVILKEQYNISATTFYRDRNILQSEKKSIPSDRLDVYATLFGKTVEELKNYKVTGISLSQIGYGDESETDSSKKYKK